MQDDNDRYSPQASVVTIFRLYRTRCLDILDKSIKRFLRIWWHLPYVLLKFAGHLDFTFHTYKVIYFRLLFNLKFYEFL